MNLYVWNTSFSSMLFKKLIQNWFLINFNASWYEFRVCTIFAYASSLLHLFQIHFFDNSIFHLSMNSLFHQSFDFAHIHCLNIIDNEIYLYEMLTTNLLQDMLVRRAEQSHQYWQSSNNALLMRWAHTQSKSETITTQSSTHWSLHIHRRTAISLHTCCNSHTTHTYILRRHDSALRTYRQAWCSKLIDFSHFQIRAVTALYSHVELI